MEVLTKIPHVIDNLFLLFGVFSWVGAFKWRDVHESGASETQTVGECAGRKAAEGPGHVWKVITETCAALICEYVNEWNQIQQKFGWFDMAIAASAACCDMMTHNEPHLSAHSIPAGEDAAKLLGKERLLQLLLV